VDTSLPVYKALAKFWLFLHQWRLISDKLKKDLSGHSAKIGDKKPAQTDDGQIVETEMVR
jgi:hypothetical protein